jgi:sporulation protein YlmC with PRC-barrel domain
MPRRSPLRLPVKTVSGKSLGHIVDLEIDIATHSVTAYHVKPNRLMPDMVSTPLIISPSQVVEITAEQMIVEDASIGQEQAVPQPSA